MGKQRSRRSWRRICQEFEGSGLTVAQFARRRGVSRQSLYRWRREFSTPSRPASASLVAAGFVELVAGEQSGPSAEVVVAIGDARLVFAGALPPAAWLRKLALGC